MIRNHGFCRVACVVPEVCPGDVPGNTRHLLDVFQSANSEGAAVILAPELALSGYSCGDLFYQSNLLRACEEALAEIVKKSAGWNSLLVFGLPVDWHNRIFNCAAIVYQGDILGLVPKISLPNTGEFYEQRWFSSGLGMKNLSIRLLGQEVPFGTDLLFAAGGCPELTVGVEICNDLWGPTPPSSRMALGGASLLLNLSASPEILGKAAYRRDLVRQQSARCSAAYAYTSSGPGESTTDLVFGGHCLVAENGRLLSEGKRFDFSSHFTLADVDLELIGIERRRNRAFAVSPTVPSDFRTIRFAMETTPVKDNRLFRPLSSTPFVPENPAERAENCREIFSIQSTGLARRLRHLNMQKVVLGLSGGLDSTLALLVCLRAFEQCGLDRSGIVAVGMPGPGTTSRTKNNSARLAELLGVSFREIPIHSAVASHLADIGQKPDLHDTTFENAQARERTQVLMDLANLESAIVVGTGDLSESALGWCTFNGDHMSMYHVNAGVPKTLVRYLIAWCAEELFSGEAAKVLADICATPITPELLPPDKDGNLLQETERTIGPYELHDFFLYHFLRGGADPEKLRFLALHCFGETMDEKEIYRWLDVFLRRFFSQQFKRNAMPDGPKVGTVALSPRGDWRMPSDFSPTVWLPDTNPPA